MPPPDSDKDAAWKFRNVIEFLIETWKNGDYSKEFKEKWEIHGFDEFLELFQRALPSLNQWRFYRKYVYSELVT